MQRRRKPDRPPARPENPWLGHGVPAGLLAVTFEVLYFLLAPARFGGTSVFGVLVTAGLSMAAYLADQVLRYAQSESEEPHPFEAGTATAAVAAVTVVVHLLS
ncbi:MAG: hypothetical protein HOY71_45575 [Nonomuraea sp.]|nr:hypothetical protein [Nonomuraea sp.]